MTARPVIEGLDTVMQNLNDEISRLPRVLRKNLIKAGLYMQARIQEAAPVETGNLRNSISTVWSGAPSLPAQFKGGDAEELKAYHELFIEWLKGELDDKSDSFQVAVAASAAYAAAVEVKSTPFFEMGVLESTPQVIAILGGTK